MSKTTWGALFLVPLATFAAVYLRPVASNSRIGTRLDITDQRLLLKLANNSEAWSSGLMRDLLGGFTVKRTVWKSSFKDSSGHDRYVYLLDYCARPAASNALTLTCVMTTADGKLLAWDTVAPFSFGFRSASIEVEADSATLKLETRANWFRGIGVYRYRLDKTAITQIGEDEYLPREDTGLHTDLLDDPPELHDILPDLRDRDVTDRELERKFKQSIVRRLKTSA